MLKVTNLTKKYGNLCAVDDISFEINDGEIVGLLGPNGAGKSTTLNVITGYLTMDIGSVQIEGIDINEKPLEAKKHIGFLPEVPPLYSDMTVWEYLEFIYELKGCKFNKLKHLNEICEVVRIFDVRKKLIRTLSKGYKQRVGIAAAIVGDPKIVILDEPTVGLDPVQIIEVRNLIRNLGKKHTVILSSHLLSEVESICDRVIVMNEGRVVANERVSTIATAVSSANTVKVKVCGPRGDILNTLKSVPRVSGVIDTDTRDGEAYTFLVESASGVDVRKAIFTALAKKNYAIIGMQDSTAELEDTFVKLISKKR